MRNTGMFSTRAETSGNAAAGRQPPRRRRSQNKEGAYASEKSSAATIREVKVTPLMFVAPSCSPSKNKVNRMADSPSSHEPSEMEMSLMVSFSKGGVISGISRCANFKPLPGSSRGLTGQTRLRVCLAGSVGAKVFVSLTIIHRVNRDAFVSD